MNSPTTEELRAAFTYDPETGVLVRVHLGRTITHVGDRGYIRVHWGPTATMLRVHRIIWQIVTGDSVPVGMEIDHIDGNKTNNRMSNLRLATHCENSRNRAIRKDATSGFKGVSASRDSPGRPWKAYIRANGKSRHLGHHATPELAHAAYCAAAADLFGDFACFGREVAS